MTKNRTSDPFNFNPRGRLAARIRAYFETSFEALRILQFRVRNQNQSHELYPCHVLSLAHRRSRVSSVDCIVTSCPTCITGARSIPLRIVILPSNRSLFCCGTLKMALYHAETVTVHSTCYLLFSYNQFHLCAAGFVEAYLYVLASTCKMSKWPTCTPPVLAGDSR
jgi:hypothetical protein